MPGLSRLLVAALFALSLNVDAQESPTLGRIAARGSIHLGYREAAPPFSYLAPGQSVPVGYTWDICLHLAKAVEARLGKSIRIVPVPVSDNARVMLLRTGIVDLDCGAATNSVARQKQVGFSSTVYVSETRIMVRKDSGISTFDQLAGKRVVVLAGGATERLVKQSALGSKMLLTYQLANSPDEAMASFAKGEVAAYIGDDASLAVQRAGNGDYRLLAGALAAEPYGIMMPVDEPLLKQLVDESLAGLMQNGDLFRIYEKWFVQPEGPAKASLDLPMSDRLKAAIQLPNDTPVN